VIGDAAPLRRRAALAADRWLAAAGPWRRWSLVLPLLGIGVDELTWPPSDDLTPESTGQRAQRVGPLPTPGLGPERTRLFAEELAHGLSGERTQSFAEELEHRFSGEGAPGSGDELGRRGGEPGHDRAGENVGARWDARVEWVLGELGAVLREPCLVLLDLAPGLGAAAGARVYAGGRAHPVLMLGRWPVSSAVLPAQPLLDMLIGCAPRARPGRLPSAVVVLDGERGQPVLGRSPHDPRTDNRYALDLDDLPDASTLRALGVRRVHVVRASRASSRPDARDALPRYAAAGLEVSDLVAPW
jgi:hypothetical protein